MGCVLCVCVACVCVGRSGGPVSVASEAPVFQMEGTSPKAVRRLCIQVRNAQDGNGAATIADRVKDCALANRSATQAFISGPAFDSALWGSLQGLFLPLGRKIKFLSQPLGPKKI